MILNNCRIDASNGIRFFDQDILIDDFVYNDYAELELTISYNTPGFGIVLFNNSTSLLSTENEAFLFRIGYREASIEYKTGYLNRTMVSIPTTIYPGTHCDNIKVKFRKYRRNIYLDINDTSIFDTKLFKLPKDISKFCLGIYSNAGNIIKYIQSNSKIPDYWNINMFNTIGGRIKFFNDGFEVSECNEKAEVEQMKITLPAGKYYLHYKYSDKNDIKCYVFISDNTAIKDDQKNILDYSDNSITLEKETSINIKFVGTYGTVSNIILNQDQDSNYVYTTDDNKDVPSSNIIINKNNISRVEWSAMVTSFGTKGELYLIKDGTYILQTYSSPKGSFELNKIYKFTYNLETRGFTVSYNDETEMSTFIDEDLIDDKQFSILKNVDAILYYLTIYEKDGTITNIITDNVKKISVPYSRKEPIIITDEYDEPLNISSSYRIYTVLDNNGNIDYDQDKYVFTNIEREVYETSQYNNYRTEFDISENINAVRVYGISNETIDYDNIYRVINHIDDIGLCCNNNYKQINPSELTISRLNNEIVINSDTSDYKYIIIDYLKDKSYCINPNFDKDTYEVEVSSNSKLKYYFAPNSSSVMSDYKIISFDNFDNESYYLCIRNND